jgi:hypothetical protein
MRGNEPVNARRVPFRYGLGRLFLLQLGLALLLAGIYWLGMFWVALSVVLAATLLISLRRPQLGLLWCIVLSMATICVWVWSDYESIGIFSLANDTSLRIRNGMMEFRRIYAHNIAAPIPEREWHDRAVAQGWILPTPPRHPFFGFHFRGVLGIGGEASTPLRTIQPAAYWTLWIPLWALLVILVLPWPEVHLWRRIGRQRSGGRTVSSAGRFG